jgi:hypothetical protein
VLLFSSGSLAGEPFPVIEPIETEHFVLYLSQPSYESRVDAVLSRTRLRLGELLLDTLGYKPDIYVVDDLRYFNYLVGGGFPDWGAAAAIPSKRRIVLKSPAAFNVQKSLEELLSHELAHLALAQRTGYHSAPRWFQEGLAMMVSAEWDWSDNVAMGRASVFASFLSLESIERVNRFGETKAHLAYSESYLATTHLFEEYSRKMVRVMLDSLAAGSSYDQALIACTGGDVKEFEAELKQKWYKRFNLTSLFIDMAFFWLALAAVVVIAFFMQYRKRRAYYKKWEEEEQFHSTDFDYGDPDHPEQTDDDEPWRS